MDATKLRQLSVLAAAVLAALVAEEATLAALGAPAWVLLALSVLAGVLGVRQPGTQAIGAPKP